MINKIIILCLKPRRGVIFVEFIPHIQSKPHRGDIDFSLTLLIIIFELLIGLSKEKNVQSNLIL